MSYGTFKTVVQGDTYLEIVENSEEEIGLLLEIDRDSISKYATYELLIEKNDVFDAEFTYKAEMIARLK
jgi:phage portal protein BeeE